MHAARQPRSWLIFDVRQRKSMQRDSTEKLFLEWPGLRRVLHECAGCHSVGVKPGILATKHGDYGMRQAIKGRFEELRIGAHGLCDRCAEEAGISNES
jgi:hypothetical protein